MLASARLRDQLLCDGAKGRRDQTRLHKITHVRTRAIVSVTDRMAPRNASRIASARARLMAMRSNCSAVKFEEVPSPPAVHNAATQGRNMDRKA